MDMKEMMRHLNDDDSDEKVKFFINRTNRHVNLVSKYCRKIIDINPIIYDKLIKRYINHDQSKYIEPEYEPYVHLTWNYKCIRDNEIYNISDDMKKKIVEATKHHILNNRHHPEFHDSTHRNNIINVHDRDKPSGILINATKMSNIDIAEMVADWCAMSEEKGTNPRDWADKNIGVRWKFSDNQRVLIYQLIDAIYFN